MEDWDTLFYTFFGTDKNTAMWSFKAIYAILPLFKAVKVVYYWILNIQRVKELVVSDANAE